jgi:hypothetical protein
MILFLFLSVRDVLCQICDCLADYLIRTFTLLAQTLGKQSQKHEGEFCLATLTEGS